MIEVMAPEEVGMSSSHLEALDATMQALVDQGKFAGMTTLIARYGKVVHFGCYGQRDIAANRPVQPNTIFRLYSLTKPITSVAALMLYEEGRFNFHDPVAYWIPQFKNLKVFQRNSDGSTELRALEKDITVWHLLTHTSGLCYGFFTDTPVEDLYREAQFLSPIVTLQTPLSELIQKLAALPLDAQPETMWRYSLAHDVIGYLIEVISDQPFDVFLRERVFEPLGMQDTRFYVPQEKLERFGTLYSATEDSGLLVVDDTTTSPFVHPDAIPSGGAGLVSTMPDYSRFLMMLTNGGELEGVRLLKSSTVKMMTTNQLTGKTFPVRFNGDPWPGMGFGLGVGVQVADASQDGWPPGVFGWIGVSGTAAWVYPREEMLTIAMPQAFHNHEVGGILTKMAYEAIVV
jgi:CubicO group peptidase (beta-lactamase class C family)